MGKQFAKRYGKEWEIVKSLLSLNIHLCCICSLPVVQAFLQKLVRNLFAEGNDLFREKDFKLSLVQYVEGLNVADYAASDEVTIPKDLLCKLHVNRAACYFAMVSAFPSHPQEPGLQCCAVGKDVKRHFSWFCPLPVRTLEETTTHRKVCSLLTVALSCGTRGGQA